MTGTASTKTIPKMGNFIKKTLITEESDFKKTGSSLASKSSKQIVYQMTSPNEEGSDILHPNVSPLSRIALFSPKYGLEPRFFSNFTSPTEKSPFRFN